MSGPADESRYRALFLEESQELLDSFLNCLFLLEQDPAAREQVDELFRIAHTIKGMAGTLGYASVADFCHEAENLLDRWREDRKAVTAADVEFMFQVEAALRDLTLNPEDAASHREALEMFGAAPGGVPAAPEATPCEGGTGGEETPFPAPLPGELAVMVTLEADVAYPRLRFGMVRGRLEPLGELTRAHPPEGEWQELEPAATVAFYLSTEASPEMLLARAASVGEVALVTVVEPDEPEDEPGAAIAPSPGTGFAAPQSYQQTGIRVDRRSLDRMTNMVGEIMLLRRRLASALEEEGAETGDVLDALDRALHELEHEVLSARMVPVGTIFQRFHRLIRELAAKLGKEVEAEFVGGETEIDRYLLDRISEPLVHIIRNALDHGLEAPDEREAAGKSRRGHLRITAANEHGNVALKVEDDGRGIDAEKVLASARRRQLLEEDADELTRAQIFGILFEPGFSTAEEVTEVSGRGVGLDVVRSKVVEVGGDINLLSELGKGTKVVIEFPPTLSLLRSLLVRSGELVAAVPQNQVYRIIRLDPERLSWVRGAPVIVVDERPVVVRSLEGMLRGGDPYDLAGCAWVLVVKLSSRMEAMAVGGLLGDQELVVKPITRSLETSAGLVGTAVLAQGHLALYVDLRLLMVKRHETAELAVG